MKIIDRLYQYFDLKGIKPTAFEKAAGLSNGYLSVQKKRNADLGEGAILKILENCRDLSLGWLMTGDGSIFLEENASPFEVKKPQAQSPRMQAHSASPIAEFDPHVSVVRTKAITEAEQGIPLIPLEAAAGPFLNNSAQVFAYDCERYVVPEFSKADFLIRITGDSMEPYYIAGDMVACKRIHEITFIQWGEVYLIDSAQGVLIKRIKPGETDATITLVSDNAAYDPIQLERTELNGLARILGLLRFN